jgi:TolB-like protein
MHYLNILKRINRFKNFASYALLVILFLTGCGYRVGTILPMNIKSIAVPTFKNSTPEPGVEIGVTNQVISQFQIDGTLKVVEEEDADVRLEGELLEYRREPLRYTGTDFKDVSEYRLRLITRLTLVDLKTGQPIWAKRVVEGETTYFVGGDSLRDTERTALGALTEQERSQIPTLEEDLAHDVVESVVEGW